MGDLRGKVALITGSAGGIGRALAGHAAREGMRLVLADRDAPALRALARTLRAGGAEVQAEKVDVTSARAVNTLVDHAYRRHGAVHLLINSAGIGAGTTAWGSSLSNWKRVLDVNLYGAIHTVRACVPRMLKQGAEAHIVNVASLLGLMTFPGLCVYATSKHALVAYSEGLYHDLKFFLQAKIGVSVVCPGFVRTEMQQPERRWFEWRPKRSESRPPDPRLLEAEQFWQRLTAQGMPPEEVARRVFAGVAERRFYIYTHPGLQSALERATRARLAGGPPEQFSVQEILDACRDDTKPAPTAPTTSGLASTLPEG